jgi:hypothetical protein
MELEHYTTTLRDQLAAAAEAGGDDARAVADRLSVALEPAARLMLLEALAAAAGEITRELAPGSVELRLRANEPEFVVTAPPAETEEPGPAEPFDTAADGAVARINLRLPDRLKAQVEQAAEREGLSINSWLVRAAATAVERGGATRRSGPRGGQRYTGWGR